MSRDPFLEHARLGERSDTLIMYEEIPHLPRLKRRAREYALSDLAHAVMLVEKGIVSAERGARLLTGLLDILDRGIRRVSLGSASRVLPASSGALPGGACRRGRRGTAPDGTQPERPERGRRAHLDA